MLYEAYFHERSLIENDTAHQNEEVQNFHFGRQSGYFYKIQLFMIHCTIKKRGNFLTSKEKLTTAILLFFDGLNI